MVLRWDPVGLTGIIAFWIGFIAFVVALFLARQRGAKAPKSDNRDRRSASILWIGVQGLAIGFIAIGPVLVRLDPFSATAVVQAAVVLVLTLFAAWLFDAASREMGRNWALVARTRDDGNLVQSGPFAYIRNPIYVALFCIMVGMAIAYGHSRNLIVAVPLYAFATWMRVRHEEAVLRATFPDYDAYAARVKRFIPGLL
ncbi:methyltransferase family protein [Sphingomonas sp. MMS24-J45]|uniref:methyltransferase family protein n=1 Tax=Sphingomonas sp. MMS24-J45 TaxID=3238806 RepID=UPI00384BD63F